MSTVFGIITFAIISGSQPLQSSQAASTVESQENASNSVPRGELISVRLHYPYKRNFSECGFAKRETCVVDGDTFWLDGIKVRIADIDTPEVSKPKCAAEKALGERATQRLVTLLNDGDFQLAPVGSRDEDQYGRKLRVVVRAGKSLGDQLVREGLARTWAGRREPWC